MNSRYSIVHWGPIAYAATLSEVQLICQTIKSQGFFIWEGSQYKLVTPLSIYDNETDKNVPLE
jgi:hypothetical protein